MNFKKLILSTAMTAFAVTAGYGQEFQVATGHEGVDNFSSAASVQQQGSAVINKNPARVKYDGMPLASKDGQTPTDQKRRIDLFLDKADIQLVYDSLTEKRSANIEAQFVSAELNKKNKDAQRPLQFFTYWNYGSWIKNAEVRLFRKGDNVKGTPRKVIPVSEKGGIEWFPTEDFGSSLIYVLRLYDSKNKYDETEAKELSLIDKQLYSGDEKSTHQEAYKVWGKNSLALKNIVLHGGTVTVNGKNVPEGHKIYYFGREVPVTSKGEFVAQEVVPAGAHNVTVAVVNYKGEGVEIQRNLYIPENDYFYVALGDLTIGTNKSTGPDDFVPKNKDVSGDVYVDGRAAFFLQGKIKGSYLLTAMADTGEHNVKDMLKSLDDKDPRKLLKRINPDRYYPVFGDKSTAVEAAPTAGNMYVKLEKEKSHVLWGNYQVNIADTDFAQISRGLYGANVHLQSSKETKYGESNAKLDGFAASPETLNNRDIFRGTGGSLYYLKYQDLQAGSESLRVEIRDINSGIVVDSKNLVYGTDYTVDYIQGRIYLNNPLPSTASQGYYVSNAALNGNPVYLVANYEFTPTNSKVSGAYAGGRGSLWLGDHVKVGVSGANDSTKSTKTNIVGTDVTLRATADSYLKGEMAKSNGIGSDELASNNGGFNFGQLNSGINATNKKAFRIEGSLGHKDLGAESGKTSGYFQHRDAGFIGLGQQTSNELDQFGAQSDIDLSKKLSLRGKYDQSNDKTTKQNQKNANLDIKYKLNDHWSIGAGTGYENNSLGTRYDLGGELRYASGKNWETYIFGQNTLSNSKNIGKNNRYGIGAKLGITDRISLGGEISDGTRGIGGKLNGEYKYSDRTNFYLGYALDKSAVSPISVLNSTDGVFTTGFKSRYTDSLSVYGEEKITHDAYDVAGLTHAYGIDYAPKDRWNFGLSGEFGEVKDKLSGLSLDRKAVSGKLGYGKDGFTVGGALEYRTDKDQATNSKQESYLGRANLTHQINPAFSFQATGRAAYTQGNGNFQDAELYEGSVGLAYRPVKNDRFNALLKYSTLYDMPNGTQVAGNLNTIDYKQKSHVFAVDGIYDISKRFSLGLKYAYKIGESTSSRLTNDYLSSTAQLGIARVDYRITNKWDALGEYRWLNIKESGSTRTGALAAIYRRFGENFRLGLGYNFANTTDDLTNLNAKTQGVFVNAITKF